MYLDKLLWLPSREDTAEVGNFADFVFSCETALVA